MLTTKLGGTGLTVSRLCLGTMTFGLQTDEDGSRRILDTAADAGVNFLDTADVYPLGGGLATVGRTEEIVGRWLVKKRDRFVLATKCVGKTGPAPWDQGASRKHIIAALEASLRRLQTDHVDLYQLHSDDPSTPLDETLEALDQVVRAGKVRYIGVSNFLAYRLARALGRAEARNLTKFASVQPRYSLLFREKTRRADRARLTRLSRRGASARAAATSGRPRRRWPRTPRDSRAALRPRRAPPRCSCRH